MELMGAKKKKLGLVRGSTLRWVEMDRAGQVRSEDTTDRDNTNQIDSCVRQSRNQSDGLSSHGVL